jgi:hypothetical protein
MWWRASTLLVLGGCAQILGLDATTKDEPVDARRVDARAVDATSVRPCVGGDNRSVDPATGACYVYFAAAMPRDAARTACQGLGTGTRLASIQSAAESDLITALLGSSSAFLGGSDELVEGTFRWEDGTAVQLTRWNTGEPNNGAGMMEEDCIVAHGSLGGVWDDRPCAPNPLSGVPGAYPFVCERD